MTPLGNFPPHCLTRSISGSENLPNRNTESRKDLTGDLILLCSTKAAHTLIILFFFSFQQHVEWKKKIRFPHPHIQGGGGDHSRCAIVFWWWESYPAVRRYRLVLSAIAGGTDQLGKTQQVGCTEVDWYNQGVLHGSKFSQCLLNRLNSIWPDSNWLGFYWVYYCSVIGQDVKKSLLCWQR